MIIKPDGGQHAAGASTARYTYGPYGEPDAWTGARFRYTGQAATAVGPARAKRSKGGPNGLYYYRARYYDPALDRFLQTDPVLYADQMNLYAYVGNNPLNLSDPSGMFQQDRSSTDNRPFTPRILGIAIPSIDPGRTQHMSDHMNGLIASTTATGLDTLNPGRYEAAEHMLGYLAEGVAQTAPDATVMAAVLIADNVPPVKAASAPSATIRVSAQTMRRMGSAGSSATEVPRSFSTMARESASALDEVADIVDAVTSVQDVVDTVTFKDLEERRNDF